MGWGWRMIREIIRTLLVALAAPLWLVVYLVIGVVGAMISLVETIDANLSFDRNTLNIERIFHMALPTILVILYMVFF